MLSDCLPILPSNMLLFREVKNASSNLAQKKRKGREIRLENTWEIDKMSESIKMGGEEKGNALYGWDNS